MEFSFSEEQEQFREVVARFCRDKSPTSTIRELSESPQGYDPGIWTQLCEELGLVGIHIPESRGGSGFTATELGIIMEELGRSLLPVPYLSASLACSAVSQIEDSTVRDDLMARLVAGQEIGTLALDTSWGNPALSGELQGSKLTTKLRAVLEASAADYILAVLNVSDGTRLVMFRRDAPGVTVTALRTMDGTRRFSDMELNNVEVTELADLSSQQVTHLYNTAVAALACETAGCAQTLLDSTVEYTQMRVQFGRPMGSFQAITHRLADLHVDVELAKVSAWQAAATLAAGLDASINASIAKFTCSEVGVHAALEAIQLRGGIGFTWEDDTHLWYRRVKSSEVFLGTPAFHRERMLKEMLE